jgi:hypothetical protein
VPGLEVNALSNAAIELLRPQLAGERVILTEEANPVRRDLVVAGMTTPLHTFALGRDAGRRLMEGACELLRKIGDPSNAFAHGSAPPWSHR